MSTLRKVTLTPTLLLALAIYAQPAYSASAGVAQASAAPGAAQAPGSAAASSAEQSFLRLNRLLADDLRGAVPVLVIPAKEMTPETYDRIVDDLSIMNRIIEKNTRVMGDMGRAYGAILGGPGDVAVPRVLRSSGGRPKPMFIGGYGVIFSLTVDFPLVPPPQTPEPNKVADKTDATWAQAQRELQDPQGTLRMGTAASQGRVYRPEAVEALRSSLIGLLKHATNIRDLEPEAWLTILVQGPLPTTRDGSSDSGSAVTIYGDQSPYGSRHTLVVPETRSEGRTLLTVRAKKADVDQYAKGQLDDTQFQQRVQIVTH
jgi:hypothetical protein